MIVARCLVLALSGRAEVVGIRCSVSVRFLPSATTWYGPGPSAQQSSSRTQRRSPHPFGIRTRALLLDKIVKAALVQQPV